MKKEILAQGVIEVGFHNRHAVEIEYLLTKCGCFTASGGYWNRWRTDYTSCGQVLDMILIDFPRSIIVQRVHKVWKEWHLNNLTAGSPAQEEEVAKWKAEGNPYTYANAAEHLKKVGLNPDHSFLHKGEVYSYGHAWIKRTLPKSIIREIQSW